MNLEIPFKDLPLRTRLFKNNKKGDIYYLLEEAIDCTNERDGEVVVVYRLRNREGPIFVRNKEEFLTKFTEV